MLESASVESCFDTTSTRSVLASRLGPLITLLAGLAMPLAFAPFGLAWLAPPGLAVMFAVAAVAPRRRALAAAYTYGLGYAGFGVYWIFISVSRYGGGPLAGVFVTAVFVALFALIPLAAIALGRAVARGRESMAALFALPLAWVAVEWIRSWLFTGTTWLTVGYTQTDTPLAVVAPVFGTYGISLLLALAAGTLAYLLIRPSLARLAAPAVAAAVLVAIALLPWPTWTRPAGEPLQVALLQGNVPQDQKWLPENRVDTLQWYASRSRAQFGKDLVVWPETAVPAWYHQVRERFLLPLARDAAAAGTDIVTGVPVIDAEREAAFNGVVRLGEDPAFYYKRHLVPFGEYVPFRDVLGYALAFLGAPMADFTAGTSAAPIRAAGVPIGVSICYEVTFGAEVAAALPEAGLLLNVSNDAWFGDSLAPHQHLQMARMRAIETGRWLLRATNTGITAIVNHRGAVVSRASSFQNAVLTGTVQPRTGATPYVRWTDWPVVGVVFLGLAAVAIAARRRRRSD